MSLKHYLEANKKEDPHLEAVINNQPNVLQDYIRKYFKNNHSKLLKYNVFQAFSSVEQLAKQWPNLMKNNDLLDLAKFRFSGVGPVETFIIYAVRGAQMMGSSKRKDQDSNTKTGLNDIKVGNKLYEIKWAEGTKELRFGSGLIPVVIEVADEFLKTTGVLKNILNDLKKSERFKDLYHLAKSIISLENDIKHTRMNQGTINKFQNFFTKAHELFSDTSDDAPIFSNVTFKGGGKKQNIAIIPIEQKELDKKEITIKRDPEQSDASIIHELNRLKYVKNLTDLYSEIGNRIKDFYGETKIAFVTPDSFTFPELELSRISTARVMAKVKGSRDAIAAKRSAKKK